MGKHPGYDDLENLRYLEVANPIRLNRQKKLIGVIMGKHPGYDGRFVKVHLVI